MYPEHIVTSYYKFWLIVSEVKCHPAPINLLIASELHNCYEWISLHDIHMYDLCIYYHGCL